MKYLEACQTLGLESDASMAEGKTAYRRLAHTHHPDKGGDAEKFKQLALAYRVFKKYSPLMQAGGARRAQPQAQQSSASPRKKTFSDEEIDAMRQTAASAEQRYSHRVSENQRIVLFLGGCLTLFYFVWWAGGDFFLYYACFLLDLLSSLFLGTRAVFFRCTNEDWSLPIYIFTALLFLAYAISSETARRRILRASYFWR